MRLYAPFLLWLLASTALALDAVHQIPVVDYVTVIELNHVYSDSGELNFTQLIYYDFNPAESRYDVVDWRLAKGPWEARYDVQRDLWLLTWFDGQTLRSVRAATFRETWSQYDRELAQREVLPQERRRKLTSPR